MNKQEYYFKKNYDLASNLAINLLKDYASECEVDPDKKRMDPTIGTYNLINQIAIALLYKADGYIDDVIDIMNIAIRDAKETVEKTKKLS